MPPSPGVHAEAIPHSKEHVQGRVKEAQKIDFGIFQWCFSGDNNPADPNCMN